MALFDIPLLEITEQHLDRLIRSEIAESRNIDYKRDPYGDKDDDRAEWLADISSFANTTGGDIVIGMDARQGVPAKINPLTIDLDKEILRLESMARDNLQPRLPALHFQPVPLSGGGQALIIRVPRSYAAPHRVVRNGKGGNRFWARSSAGKYEPNVDELRVMFLHAPQLVDRMRDFRLDRIAKIASGAAPVTLMHKPCLIMHVVPFSAFDPSSLVSLVRLEQKPHPFAPIGSTGAMNWRANFDGFFIPSNGDLNAPTQRAYTQIFRSGIVESVDSSIVTTQGRLQSIWVEGRVIRYLVRYLRGLHELGIEPPFGLFVSLIGVKDVPVSAAVGDQWYGHEELFTLDRDQLHFTEVLLNGIPQHNQDCAAMIRPFIEQVANMAGLAASTSFDGNGNYIHVLG